MNQTIAKPKKLSKKNLERKLWALCREIIIKKYGKKCFTCKKPIEGSSLHIGHFIPRSTCGSYLKYDLRNLRPQCPYCNTFLGGNGAEYARHMYQTEGHSYVEGIFRDKQKIVKAQDYWEKQLREYQVLKTGNIKEDVPQ